MTTMTALDIYAIGSLSLFAIAFYLLLRRARNVRRLEIDGLATPSERAVTVLQKRLIDARCRKAAEEKRRRKNAKRFDVEFDFDKWWRS